MEKVTNQNCVLEKVKSRWNCGNVRNLSVQNVWSHLCLSGNLKFTIYRNLIFPFVLYGCETWFLILKAEHRLKLFKIRVLRKIFGPTLGLSGTT
jgi:hypothetical protein